MSLGDGYIGLGGLFEVDEGRTVSFSTSSSSYSWVLELHRYLKLEASSDVVVR